MAGTPPPGPVVAIVGATGYVGKFLTEAFLIALKESRVKELRVLSTRQSTIVQGFEEKGAKPYLVDFSKKDTLVQAFTGGVDIVVSAFGTGPNTEESKHTLLDAIAVSGVKIYFPSEFGTNHYSRVKAYVHPLFEGKKQHFHEAQSKGIKTIRILCSDIMESTFGKWYGLDTKAEIWTLVGKGETPVAVSAERDIGRYTVEAALKAYQAKAEELAQFPDLIEVYSDMKTMKEYAAAFDKVAGRPTTLKFVPLEEAVAKFNANQKFEDLLQILFEEGAYDYRTAEGNQLLNPGETVWSLKKIEEYAEETNGRPWKDFEG